MRVIQVVWAAATPHPIQIDIFVEIHSIIELKSDAILMLLERPEKSCPEHLLPLLYGVERCRQGKRMTLTIEIFDRAFPAEAIVFSLYIGVS